MCVVEERPQVRRAAGAAERDKVSPINLELTWYMANRLSDEAATTLLIKDEEECFREVDGD